MVCQVRLFPLQICSNTTSETIIIGQQFPLVTTTMPRLLCQQVSNETMFVCCLFFLVLFRGRERARRGDAGPAGGTRAGGGGGAKEGENETTKTKTTIAF